MLVLLDMLSGIIRSSRRTCLSNFRQVLANEYRHSLTGFKSKAKILLLLVIIITFTASTTYIGIALRIATSVWVNVSHPVTNSVTVHALQNVLVYLPSVNVSIFMCLVVDIIMN